MFVDRENGILMGVFTCSQYEGQEEIADDDQELIDFQNRTIGEH